MTNTEFFNHHFNDLKKSAPEDVTRHAIAILEKFTFFEKTEQKEFGETIYAWAKQHAKRKPLIWCYANFIQAFSIYYREFYTEALPLIIETQNLFIAQNDVNGAALCHVIQGSIYRTFGNLDLALKEFWEAHDQLKNKDTYQHYFLACSINMAGTYFEMKHYEEAIPLFKDSMEMAESSGRYYWTIYALHGLGKVYLAQKNYPDAKSSFEKAMMVAEENNHPLSICNSLSELGNYYYTTGDYTEAEKFHTRSLDSREKNLFIGGAITSCIRLGEIYINQARPDDAITVLEKGLKMAEQIKVKLKMYQIHFLLSEIYKGKNDLQKSFFHYRLFHDLREQVEIEDSARKLKNAHLVFEAEQTKKENIIIKRQKQEIEKKNIELQETIDELTRARVGKKARAITLIIAIVLFIMEDTILHFALSVVPGSHNYFISLIVKMVIIFSLSPINKAIEHYLLNRIIKKEKKEVLMASLVES